MPGACDVADGIVEDGLVERQRRDRRDERDEVEHAEDAGSLLVQRHLEPPVPGGVAAGRILRGAGTDWNAERLAGVTTPGATRVVRGCSESGRASGRQRRPRYGNGPRWRGSTWQASIALTAATVSPASSPCSRSAVQVATSTIARVRRRSCLPT